MASVRRVGALVGQVACEHYTVWSKATALVDELGRLRALGEEALHAGCGALAAKLVQQGAMMVEKSPGIAYALAGVALAVGEAEPLVWACLRDRLCAACCYVAPCYVKRPEGASNDEWKRAMGYKTRADGRTLEKKEAYYNRMGAYMSMWAALLQASAVPTFPRTNGANDSTMLVRPANNPLGVGAAWSWLARLLNAPPQRITAALLYPFLHGCAHSSPPRTAASSSFTSAGRTRRRRAPLDGRPRAARRGDCSDHAPRGVDCERAQGPRSWPPPSRARGVAHGRGEGAGRHARCRLGLIYQHIIVI